MKTLVQSLATLTLAVSLSYGEEAPAKDAKAKGPNLEKAFKKLDTDSNNSLSLEEFQASPKAKKNLEKAEEIYKKMDADSKDGVSLEEFKAAQQVDGKGKEKRKGKGKKGGADSDE